MVVSLRLVVPSGDFEEPGLPSSALPGRDSFGAFDHEIDVAVIALVTLEQPLVNDPPLTSITLELHDPGRFQDLPVGERVPLAGEVVSEVVGRLGQP